MHSEGKKISEEQTWKKFKILLIHCKINDFQQLGTCNTYSHYLNGRKFELRIYDGVNGFTASEGTAHTIVRSNKVNYIKIFGIVDIKIQMFFIKIKPFLSDNSLREHNQKMNKFTLK